MTLKCYGILGRLPKAWKQKKKLEKSSYIKLESFCSAMATVYRVTSWIGIIFGEAWWHTGRHDAGERAESSTSRSAGSRKRHWA